MSNLNIENQLELLNQFQRYYSDLPFESNPKDGIRYYLRNLEIKDGMSLTF